MNPADLALTSLSPTLTTKGLSLSNSSLQKSTKTSVPRIDVEPIYTQLKGALASHWMDYKAAINSFILGNLNQAELSWVLQPILSHAPIIIPTTISTASSISINQLHNQLITCLYNNITRDLPPTEVAPWVVATDKPSAAKNAGAVGASDKAEERLKKEIMALQARDRRRLKALKPDTTNRPEGGLRDMQDYRFDLVVNASESAALGSGDVAKTWDTDKRRKYAVPLASETLEFPSTSDLQTRVESTSYDEGFGPAPQAVIQACTELLEQAAEAHIKHLLGELQVHIRSNGTGCIQTAEYKQLLRKQESDAERGILQRTATGLLPVEVDMQRDRAPLGQAALHMAFELRNPLVAYDHLLTERTMLSQWPTTDRHSESCTSDKAVRPALDTSDDVLMDDAPAWQGSSMLEQHGLFSSLDDCLATA